MRTVSLGILAALAGLALSASVVTGQGAQQGAQGDAQAEDVQPLKQVKLTDRKIQGYIAAQKQLAPLTDKLEAAGEKADPALDKQIEQIAKSNGFASTEEGNLLSEEEQWRKLRFVAELASSIWPRARR